MDCAERLRMAAMAKVLLTAQSSTSRSSSEGIHGATISALGIAVARFEERSRNVLGSPRRA
jgi:hypothetical protein